MNEQQTYPTTNQDASTPIPVADMPVDEQGRIYHLQLKPGQVAPDILLVGDPGRARFIGSTFLRDVEVEHEHRGLVIVTGIADVTGEPTTVIAPMRTTVTTSGMGTSSLEIVASELVALNEIDFATRTHRDSFPRLHIIRVGTSGALQASTPLGTSIITSYSIGLDNAGLYYEAPYPDEHCERLEQELAYVLSSAMSTGSRFYGKLQPYVSRAEPAVVKALSEAAKSLGVPARVGLTISAPGFFAPQGRDIHRIPPSVPDMDRIFEEFNPRLGGQRVENMEMEASFLLHFFGGMGCWAGEICAAIANRRKNTFYSGYQEAIKNATRVALLALANLRESRG